MSRTALVLAMLTGVAGLWFLSVCAVEFVWNAVAVSAFGAPALSFWQVAGCMFLLGLIGNAIRGGGK